MDEDLKQYLEGMRTELLGKIDRAAVATAGEVSSLHSRIQQSEKRLGAQLASIDTRLKLQAGLIRAGARDGAVFRICRVTQRSAGLRSCGRVEALEKRLGEGGEGKP